MAPVGMSTLPVLRVRLCLCSPLVTSHALWRPRLLFSLSSQKSAHTYYGPWCRWKSSSTHTSGSEYLTRWLLNTASLLSPEPSAQQAGTTDTNLDLALPAHSVVTAQPVAILRFLPFCHRSSWNPFLLQGTKYLEQGACLESLERTERKAAGEEWPRQSNAGERGRPQSHSFATLAEIPQDTQVLFSQGV